MAGAGGGFLGWMFDGLEMGIVPTRGPTALQTMMPALPRWPGPVCGHLDGRLRRCFWWGRLAADWFFAGWGDRMAGSAR